MKKDSNIANDNLVMGIFVVTVLFMSIWTTLIVHDIKQDVKDISGQLDSMRVTLTEMLKPMEQLCKVPEGLEEYLKVDTDISAEANQ
jgi:hypothetical protein